MGGERHVCCLHDDDAYVHVYGYARFCHAAVGLFSGCNRSQGLSDDKNGNSDGVPDLFFQEEI